MSLLKESIVKTKMEFKMRILIPRTLLRRRTALPRVRVVDGSRHRDIMTPQFGSVDLEMMNQFGLRWNAQLSRRVIARPISNYLNHL